VPETVRTPVPLLYVAVMLVGAPESANATWVPGTEPSLRVSAARTTIAVATQDAARITRLRLLNDQLQSCQIEGFPVSGKIRRGAG